MSYTKEQKEEQKERLRDEFRANGYQVKVFHLGDNKMIACYAVQDKYSGNWEVWQLNPNFLKAIGLDVCYRKTAADKGYFWKKWGGVDELVMELSHALFAFTEDSKNCDHAKYRERDIKEGHLQRPEGEIGGIQYFKNGTKYDINADYVLKRR
jgi:hypothetical protein